MRRFWLFASLCALLTVSCDDSVTSCKEGEAKCDQNQLLICESGSWVMRMVCGENTCNATKQSCDKTEQEPTPVDPNNIDQVSTEICNDEYLEGCDGEVARFCNEDGYITRRDCSKLRTDSNPVVCKTASSNFADCVIPCNASTFSVYKTCEENYVATHYCERTTDNKYYEFSYTDEPCPVACSDGECVNRIEEKPKVGSACQVSTFKPECHDNELYECVNSVITKTSCGSKTCGVQKDTKNGICGDRCQQYGDDILACSSDKKSTDNKICLLTENNKYVYFPQKETCKNSCKNGYCDLTLPENGEMCDQSMKDICYNNSLYYCNTDDNKVSIVYCPSVGQNGFCKDMADGAEGLSGYSDCVIPCIQGSEDIMQCVTNGKDEDGNRSYEFDNWKCLPGKDGSYYYFSFQGECAGTCKDGVCL